MALTRPNSSQVNTRITAFSDPVTVLNQGSTVANVDVGFLFNRANGLVSNVALYWSESTQSIVTAFTSDTGVTNSNISPSSYANLTIGNLLLVQGSILGVVGNLSINGINAATIGNTGSQGIFGNVSTSGTQTVGNIITTNGVFWANGTAYGGGSSATGSSMTYTSIYLGRTTASTATTLIDTIPVIGNARVSWDTISNDSINNQFRVSTIDSINNGTIVNYNEYGVVLSNAGTTVTTFTSNITSGNINLWAVDNSASVSVTFERTVLGSATTIGYLAGGSSGGSSGTTYTSTGTGNIAVSGSTLALSATGPGPVTVGSASAIPIITTDAYGRIVTITAATVVTPSAGTLTGTTLASGITNSSLTSVGTLTSLVVTGNITSSTNFIGNGSALTGIPSGARVTGYSLIFGG